MEQLVPIFNELVAFFKSDAFKGIVNSLMAVVKSIDVGQIASALKKIIEVVGTLAK